MRNTFNVGRNDVQIRESVHQRTNVVLIHDQQMPERELSSSGIDSDNAGVKPFDRLNNKFAENGVSRKIKPLFLQGTFKYNATSLFA